MNFEDFRSVISERLLIIVLMTMMVMTVKSILDNRARDLLPILIYKGRPVNQTVVVS
jgi:hypothetical protein